jgi:hypothetical protein
LLHRAARRGIELLKWLAAHAGLNAECGAGPQINSVQFDAVTG